MKMTTTKWLSLGSFLALSIVGLLVYAQDARHSHGDETAQHGGHGEAQHGGQHGDDRHGGAHGGHGDAQHGGHGEHGGHGDGQADVEVDNFPTIGFEETHEAVIPFPVADVAPLFEPDGRNLVYRWWDPTVLREAEGETLEGLVTVTTMQSHDIFLIVTKHEPERGYIQYLVLWDDFELQRIDITCVEGETEGSTKVTWTERNAGLHENGVSMVSQFVEGGHLGGVVERYANNVETHLRGE